MTSVREGGREKGECARSEEVRMGVHYMYTYM